MKIKGFLITLLAIGLAVSSYYIYLFTKNVNSSAFKIIWTIGLVSTVVIAVSAQMVAHILRAHKSRILLDPIRPAKVRTLFRGLAVGYLYNAILPFRAGEFIRAHLVGRAMRISRSVVFF